MRSLCWPLSPSSAPNPSVLISFRRRASDRAVRHSSPVSRSSLSLVEHMTHPAVRQDKQAPQEIKDMEAQPHSCVTGSISSPLCCYLAGTRASK
jgi:hypothetical protein